MLDLTKKIAVVLNVRAESNRIPDKMLATFAGKSLFEICVEKLLTSKVFKNQEIFVAYNSNDKAQGFRKVMNKINSDSTKICHEYERSPASTMEENDQSLIYEFNEYVKTFRYDYCILVNPCCPLLSIETIDAFYSTFKYSDKDGLFGVIKKKNYFWDNDKRPINLPGHGGIMNTKDPNCQVYEAAHCLYGSKLSFIDEKRWMGGFTKDGPELFIIPENETFDIDYPWQFEYGELLYKGLSR